MSTGHSSGSGIGDTIKKGVGLVHGTGEALRGNFNAAVDSAAGDGNSASAQRHRDVAAKGVDEIEYGYHRKGETAHVAPGNASVGPGNQPAPVDAHVAPGQTAYPATGNPAHVAPGHTTHVAPGHPNYAAPVDTAHVAPGNSTHPTAVHPTHPAPSNAPPAAPPSAPTAAQREHLNTTASTSTNYGSHSTNTANKLDPRFDSDLDHRGAATGSTNLGPHQSNVGNKVDPRVDSDGDHRANPGRVVR